MKPRHRRLAYVALGLVLLGITAALVLNAFRSNLVFFFRPTQVADKEAPLNKTFRLGGLVEQGSVKRQPDGVTVNFVVTDTAKSIPVRYKGILPDLFKEGKGVVAQGGSARRRVPGAGSARQARRKLHAAGSRRGDRQGAARPTPGADEKMIPELGHFALIVALGLALVQAILPLIGAARGNPALVAVARPAAQGQFVFVAIAFGCLAWAFVNNDFSVLYVAEHSNSRLPLQYRFAAVWGGHEGSLLLWVLMLTRVDGRGHGLQPPPARRDGGARPRP